MLERLSSGQPHLDAVLGGGLPANSVNMIVGLPGSGKTLLAQQYVFASATEEHPAAYCSTASEPLDKLVRYGQTLSFFEPSAVGRRVFYEDLASSLLDGGLPAVMDRLVRLLEARQLGLLVVDSFKALAAFAADAREFRTFVSELAARLAARRVTTLLVGEYSIEELGSSAEFAVADGIVALTSVVEGERVHRSLRVLKLRGSSFQSGSHAYRLSADGLAVFPRLADRSEVGGQERTDRRIATGLPILDQMFGGGIWGAGSTLLAGPSGSGKTTLGIQLLRAGVEAGERALVATMQENQDQLERMFRHYGWKTDGVSIHYHSPVDLYIDEWIYEILEASRRAGATRILIDSLSDLQLATPDPVRFLEYLYSLVQRVVADGRHVVMTLESASGPRSPLSREPISHLSDNVVVLRFLPGPDGMGRGLLVLKSRATWHDPSMRRLTIGEHGAEIGDPIPLAAANEAV